MKPPVVIRLGPDDFEAARANLHGVAFGLEEHAARVADDRPKLAVEYRWQARLVRSWTNHPSGG